MSARKERRDVDALRYHRRGRTAVLGVSAAVLAVGLGGVGALAALGVPLFAAPYQAPPGPTQLDWKLTTAAATLTSVLNAPHEGWAPDGEQQSIISPALPASCLTDLVGARGVQTQRFVVNNTNVTVSLSAYAAGVGAGAYDALVGKLSDCGGTGIEDGQGFGVQSDVLSTEPGGHAMTTSMWRRGDVLAYVSMSSDQAGGLHDVTAAVDASLNAQLSTVCVNQNSAAADAVRSPWIDRAKYVGLFRSEQVSVTDFTEPTLAPSATTSTGVPVVVTAIPAAEITLDSVTRPRTPSYPVWPDLPVEVAKPSAPVAPVKPANTTQIQVSIKDTDGPGCGWNFTGTQAPNFDQKAADARESSDQKTTQAQLVANGKGWQSQVLDYWTQYAAYSDAATKYEAYAAQVSQVKVAWDAIAAQWASYNTALSAYNNAVSARTSFLNRQQQAQSDYDAAVQACSAAPYTETRTVTPSPTTSTLAPTDPTTSSPSDDQPTSSPTSSPSPSTTVITPSPTTTTVTVYPPACPSTPSILSQSAPSVPAQPTPPADPRPANAR